MQGSDNWSYRNYSALTPEDAEEIVITPSSKDQTKIGLFNKVTVNGDADLKPENIVKGVNIFGIDGSSEAGSGGNNTPEYEYTELEYIESTGTQWINTGIKTSNSIGIELDFQLTEEVTSIGLCGGGINAVADTMLIFRVENSCFTWYVGGRDIGPAIDLNRHIMSMNVEKQKIYLDGVSYGSPGSNAGASEKNIFLFASNYYKNDVGDTVPTNSALMKVYSFKVYDNNQIIHDYIPVLDNDNVACLYDKITETYLPNAGTGSFIAGPAIVEEEYEHTEIEYIESTGTQYILTDFIPNQNSKIEILVRPVEYESDEAWTDFVWAGDGAGAVTTNFSGGFLTANSADNTFNCRFDGKAVGMYWDVNTVYDNDLKFVQSKDGLYINDELIGTYDGYSNFTSSKPLSLLTLIGGTRVNAHAQLKYCRYYENNVMVLDAIPVLDSNNVACLFDKVTETYFYNAGTGSFTAGPVV